MEVTSIAPECLPIRVYPVRESGNRLGVEMVTLTMLSFVPELWSLSKSSDGRGHLILVREESSWGMP